MPSIREALGPIYNDLPQGMRNSLENVHIEQIYQAISDHVICAACPMHREDYGCQSPAGCRYAALSGVEFEKFIHNFLRYLVAKREEKG